MLQPVLETAPASKPLTLADVKTALHVDHTHEDSLLNIYIDAATAKIDGYSGLLGRALVDQTWSQSFDGFAPCMRLPIEPFKAVSSVTYYDADNVQQTLPTSVYQVLTDELGPIFTLQAGQTWPATYLRDDAVKVTFTAGYGADDTAIPADIKQAMLLMIAGWFRNRENFVVGAAVNSLPMFADAEGLLRKYKRKFVG